MRIPSLLVLGTILAVAPPARASLTFPEALATELGLDEDPPCTLCHTTELGKKGTATKKFARSLKLCGATEKDENLLVQALRCSDQRRYNSDGDGAADVAELRDGTDPNAFDVPLPTIDDAGAGGEGGVGPALPPPAPPPFANIPLPQTGCQAPPTAPTTGLPFVAFFALARACRRLHRRATRASCSQH